ncbi:MAG: PilN domain-containing protein [Candidatus Azambacteria bacterium]|nr:PilN domain-containing protein [Candidatus Azambacteria bacterium]
MTINLIPPELKKEKSSRKIGHFASSISITIIIVLAIIFATMYGQNYFLAQNIKKIDQKIADQDITLKKYADLEQKINESNQKLEQLKKINNDKIAWSVIIKDLSGRTPSKVSIKTVTAGSDNYKISLTGSAETRRDIAKFKEKMEESKYFKNVTFSSSSLNEESNDYSFSISTELEATQ